MQDRQLSSEWDRIAGSHKLEVEKLQQTYKLLRMQQRHKLELEAKQQISDIEQKTEQAQAKVKVSTTTHRIYPNYSVVVIQIRYHSG